MKLGQKERKKDIINMRRKRKKMKRIMMEIRKMMMRMEIVISISE